MCGPLAIKMQMFTLNVDLNHLDFAPNEAWNVSSEVQCPTDKNIPKSFAFVWKRCFQGDGPLRARQFALCHFHKIIVFSRCKGPSGSYNPAASQCRNPCSRITSRPGLKYAVYPGQIYYRVTLGRVDSVPGWTKGLRSLLGTWSWCEPPNHGAQITQSP